MPHRSAADSTTPSPPVHMPGFAPGRSWATVRARLEREGHVVVTATWGEWLTAALTDTALRPLLGRDWQRYRRTANAAARYRFVTSRMLLKHTAAAVLETDPAALELAYRIGGRPFLRGFDQIDVSLSHTGDLLVVAVSRTGRIGVDAEPMGRDLSSDVLRQRICTPAEAAGLDRLTPERQAHGLLRLWTLKEAYTKALGQGMRLGFTEFGFGHDGTPRTADGCPAPGGTWAFTTHPVLDGRYLVSTACQDTGLDTARDTTARTMLDQGFTGAVRTDPDREPGPLGEAASKGPLRPLHQRAGSWAALPSASPRDARAEQAGAGT
ncbi:4'-phosphopantetheinyl transferase family protein [Streptomyces soliscabiei]|uniref:4'-phosphopantetheinyl transferase family protein n=1 Tax=Streptomyces soliscabiei TaxID=588897 RepID=UPI0029BF065A|nr:4'-phosphopantetheinyl transferase superfamily protein [Streptomyces sp. NY05-11A]MDX2680442.1 4'-phosphopantetheinyl transferase superfamily protein [Streptomyces sp. NY05-11A]